MTHHIPGENPPPTPYGHNPEQPQPYRGWDQSSSDPLGTGGSGESAGSSQSNPYSASGAEGSTGGVAGSSQPPADPYGQGFGSSGYSYGQGAPSSSGSYSAASTPSTQDSSAGQGGFSQPGGGEQSPTYYGQQGAPAYDYGQQPSPAPGQQHAGQGLQSKNFFSKLFDFSFRHYITPSIISIVYILSMVWIVLSWLVLSLVAFAAHKAFGAFVFLIVGPVFALLSLVLTRITLEFYSAVIRLAQDVSVIRGNK